MSRRFCLALDLKDDPVLIAEYRKYHEKIWPEITQSLKDSGIEDLEIYLLGTRTFMIMEATLSFSFEERAKADEHRSEGASLGAAHVGIPASVARSKARPEMATHGTYFQARSLAGETHLARVARIKP